MVMTGLALRQMRQRPGRLAATLLSTFLGAGIIMTFNSMHDTAAGTDDADSAEILHIAAGVVGGYGTLLVFFAVASTLTVNVRQRDEEIKLLRSAGATPAQIKRMILVEAVAVALVGSALAVAPAMLGGQVLLDAFKDSGQVADHVDYAFGPLALATGFDVTLLASGGAAFLAVRRATRTSAGRPEGRGRLVAGAVALVAGASSVGATFAMKETDAVLMAPPTYGAILLGVGFAVFSPSLLRMVLGWLAWPLTALLGGSGYLAVHTMRQRALQLTGMLMPLIVFTSMATATLTMQVVENDAIDASGLEKSVDDKMIETLNLVVVGILVAFSCIMLINTLYAATSYRAREFAQYRLAGATPAQVMASVGLEGVILVVLGVFLGTLAGASGILAFSAVRTDALPPDQSLWIWLAIVAIATIATFVTSLSTTRLVLRTPAVTAVAVTA